MELYKLALVGGLGLGVAYQMNTNEYKHYGLIGGDIQIMSDILLACTIINASNVNEASKLLADTIAVESMNGKAIDYSTQYGEGLTQFDKGTFEYIKEYFKDSKYNNMHQRIKNFLFIDIRSANYEDLRKRPLLSIIYARLLYFTINEPLPTGDVFARYEYYKKYYNSVLGKTTLTKYVNAHNNYSVFK